MHFKIKHVLHQIPTNPDKLGRSIELGFQSSMSGVDLTLVSRNLEITIGFVCACLPSLNLLIEHHIRKRRRQRRRAHDRARTHSLGGPA